MLKTILLNEREIPYTLKKSSWAKSMRLAIYGGGNFIVTAPASLPQNRIERFIAEKSKWVVDTIEYFKKFPATIFKKRKTKKESRAEFLLHKEKVLSQVKARLDYFNQFYGYRWSNVQIRNQKTRWGSCSRRGNLSFNYKITFLPEHLADYVIVHELCHIGEFNHSKNFWALLAQALPNWKELRRELKSKKHTHI